MSRRTTAALGALAATTAAVAIPLTGAGASDSCVAWGTLPARVTLGPHGATIHTALHGTSGCAAQSFDNGGRAVLRAADRSDDVPLRWARFGATDQATYYPSLNRPGTYRVVDGSTQTYDGDENRIPSTWRATSTVVKYQGRFASVSRGTGGVSAALQFYGESGWHGHRDVSVTLQRRTSSGWHTVARSHSGTGGRVHFKLTRGGTYRLVSATSTNVWGTTRVLGADPR